MENTIQLISQIVVLIFSVVVHEISHGYVALALGDKTAQYAGRLTLNPIKHIDPVGSLILPLLSWFFGGFILGWAKPVPYNPNNLRNVRWGSLAVGASGPLANLALALVFGILLRFLPVFAGYEAFVVNFASIVKMIVLINVVLFVFNLIPLPPLDGSKILSAFLSYRWHRFETFLESYGIMLVFLFVFLFWGLVLSLVGFLFGKITGLPF